ncbi:serine/threonine-protein kinase, partial [Angustibacter aerolatus]
MTGDAQTRWCSDGVGQVVEPPAIPGYEVGSPLGAGAGGTVWRATPCSGGPALAAKLVRPGEAAGHELAALRAVRHPHVVGLRDVAVLDDGRWALLLDLIDGGSLASVVRARGHLLEGEVVNVLSPLALALHDLHDVGVQHGDVAPGNVLLGLDGRPVLSDLGTVRLTGLRRPEVFGTAGYVDPVVLAGEAPGPASDVYGLGAMAWFALTGAPPPAPPLRRPLAELVPTVSPALLAVDERAVDADPARRPAPAELARALHDA